ncbi:fructose-1,6-bisphosphatase [Micromonospora pattaloongensis]|uniref:Fructose-1,6-bisphosphatase n=1 Tax=Micromonospora pattaloongensis TaxID=405436 RepID=A0A1H3MT90_9ACTN|nr:inositol monophosphatase family protein [Micromonospora pattaloongensis]SDY79773.1 fructose-1,6-bisphosphatase [Micromonospora pattaloongensis]
MIDEVAALLRDVAATAVLPLFGGLSETDVREKAPGDLVTVADRRAEELLTEGLTRLLPGSVVVGEEAVADDPSRLGLLRDTGDVWIVDPIDGTGNFAAGHPPFVLMVALLRGGAPVAGWIYDPIAGTLAVTEAGAGTYVDGLRMGPPQPPPGPAALRGPAMIRFLSPELRARAAAGTRRLGAVLAGQHCAGREYLDILAGHQHFALFWRALPWDHTPGALLLREAGGVAARFDGTPYDPADDRSGLLVAASDEIWHAVHTALLSAESPT